MTLFLSGEDVTAVASDDLVLAAARSAVHHQGAGSTVVPSRIDVPTEAGFLRVMPAALGDVMGLKVMTLVEGLGTRYLLLVHGTRSGELVGVLDAEQVTRLRTAATTALAGQILRSEADGRLALIGTGFEAEGHLRLLARLWPLESVFAFSPSRERREAFAARLDGELACDVRAATSSGEALAEAATAVLATKSQSPVVDGRDFPADAVVLSIGSTRPDLRELDHRTLERTALLLVDDPEQVATESGDVIEALARGSLERTSLVPMGEALGDSAALRRSAGRDLLVFKSVGTAVQDLSLARALLDAARARGLGRELGRLAELKPFANALRQAADVASAAPGIEGATS